MCYIIIVFSEYDLYLDALMSVFGRPQDQMTDYR